MRTLDLLTEATTNYVPKNVDPALLTFDEYSKVANPRGKMHPASAYQMDVSKLAYHRKSEYPKLLNTLTIRGLKFELRMSKEVMNKSPEYQALGLAIFNDQDEAVAVTENEWGALLVMVAREYRSLGLGTHLTTLARKLNPTADSGGLTNDGLDNLRRVHAKMVREYLQQGMYSYLIRQGKISKQKVKEIIQSAALEKRQKQSYSLASNNPADWQVMDAHGAYIIYDQKLKIMWETGDIYTQERFAENMIIGMVYTESHFEYCRIRTFDGSTDGVKRFLMMLALATSRLDGKPLVVEPEDVKYVDPKVATIGELSKKAGISAHIVEFTGKPLDVRGAVRAERAFRKSFDRYGEFGTIVEEMGYAKYR